MKILEAGENYLETILSLQGRMPQVRAIDIVRELKYSKPTVSVAMKQLRENGYVTIDDNGYIELSNKGLAIAKQIYERHQVIAKFLMALGVDQDIAYADSCKIEHDISEKSFQSIKEYYYTKLSDTN